jgi:hypothetical protein
MKNLSAILISGVLALSLSACSDPNPLKSGSKSEKEQTVKVLSQALLKYNGAYPMEDYTACLTGTRVERNNFGNEMDCNLMSTFVVRLINELNPNQYPDLKVEHIRDKRLFSRINEDLKANLKGA